MNTETQKLFVNYEIAKKLKKIGFNKPTMAFYNEHGDFKFVPYNESDINLPNSVTKTENENNYCSAPLYQQCEDWIRENYKLNISLNRNYDGWRFVITEFSSGNKSFFCSNNETEDYIEEMKLAILKAIELIEKQK